MKKLTKVLPVLTASSIALLLTGCESDLGQKMSNAALNTLMGMGVVFVVLIIICYVIKAFGIINKVETRKKAEKALIEGPAQPAAPAEIEEEDETDDLELVAVIAAAIAAYEGTTPEGIQVRSIRKVSSAKQWKRG